MGDLSTVSDRDFKWGEGADSLGYVFPYIRNGRSLGAVQWPLCCAFGVCGIPQSSAPELVEVDVAVAEVPVLAVEQRTSVVGRPVTLTPHRLLTSPRFQVCVTEGRKCHQLFPSRALWGRGPSGF